MKNYKKRLLSLFLVFILNSFFNIASAYVDKKDVVVSMQINNPTMQVNGIKSEIDAGRATTPVIVNDRTLVPIRAIVEAFDGDVIWDGATQTVELSMDGDTITLVINSNRAYLNNKACTLDVAPAIINERTMLPIRFIAESFNLGVAWESDSRTISIIRNSFDKEEYNYLMNVVPAYSGFPYATINGDKPLFKEYEIIGGSFEYYSNLDKLGRCDVCMASIGDDLMPTTDRESISSVTPTGWINASYDTISGKYLYNRCHLIGYQLTGENANKRNLITGTRYLNIDGMLPFENKIDDYIDRTGNNVMYRVTPVFKDGNLVADGVLLEAYSVEDNGRGISFCVYCYNVQPTIIIDYATGESKPEGGTSVIKPTTPTVSDNVNNAKIYRTPTGKRYHLDKDCGGRNSYEITMIEAQDAGLTPCAKCAK